MKNPGRVFLALVMAGIVFTLSTSIPGFALESRAQMAAYAMLLFLNMNELLKD